MTCSKIISSPRTGTRAIIRSWQKDLTDPRDHDPLNYRYLVHAVSSYNHSDIFRPTGELDIHLSTKPLIFNSLIDQDHHGTWGSYGVILKPRVDRIFCAYPNTYTERIGRINEELSRTLEKMLYKGILFPDQQFLLFSVPELLAFSLPMTYNTVILQNIPPQFAVTVTGIWIGTSPAWQVIDRSLSDQLDQAARTADLPLIHF